MGGPDTALKKKGLRPGTAMPSPAEVVSGHCPEEKGIKTSHHGAHGVAVASPDTALKKKGLRPAVLPIERAFRCPDTALKKKGLRPPYSAYGPP